MTATILLVTKPLAPPWNDSGKTLVRDLVDALGPLNIRCRVLTPRGQPYSGDHVVSDPIYPPRGAAGGGFAPSLGQNLRVALRLLRPGADLVHLFFAPNPRTSHIARALVGWRRIPTIHSVLSAPAESLDLRSVTFATRTVVLSEATRRRYAAAGVETTRIHPGVVPGGGIERPRAAEARRHAGAGDAPFVLYPGDLEFSSAARTTLEAFALLAPSPAIGGACLVMACRRKTAGADAAHARLLARAEALGLSDRVLWPGEVPDYRALAAEAAVVALPAESLYAKTDLPLAVLEAMAESTPVVVSNSGPLVELFDGNDALGAAVPPRAPDTLAAALLPYLANPEARRRAGQAAREQCAARFSAEKMARAYRDLYREVLGR